MQVTSEAVSGIARRLNVSVPTSRVNEQFEARLKRTAKTAKINGFRPGKVPLNVVRREYGAGIYQEVVNDVIRDTVFEAIQQEKSMLWVCQTLIKLKIKKTLLFMKQQ